MQESVVARVRHCMARLLTLIRCQERQHLVALGVAPSSPAATSTSRIIGQLEHAVRGDAGRGQVGGAALLAVDEDDGVLHDQPGRAQPFGGPDGAAARCDQIFDDDDAFARLPRALDLLAQAVGLASPCAGRSMGTSVAKRHGGTDGQRRVGHAGDAIARHAGQDVPRTLLQPGPTAPAC